jgi:hypothetical protein
MGFDTANDQAFIETLVRGTDWNTTLKINQNGGAVAIGAGSLTAGGALYVNDFARIDALRVGTTSTDPGDGNLVVEGDISGSYNSTGSFGHLEIQTGTIDGGAF